MQHLTWSHLPSTHATTPTHHHCPSDLGAILIPVWWEFLLLLESLLLESFQQKSDIRINTCFCCSQEKAKPGPVRSSFNNPFMMQMFVEGLECARLCSDIGDKMAAKREWVRLSWGLRWKWGGRVRKPVTHSSGCVITEICSLLEKNGAPWTYLTRNLPSNGREGQHRLR